ncbi:MAG: PQQ-like beta-propeller repeat protein, partial [Planctomycetaceae bacterium]|nr:PQQ-like beta-propeller repeat protein [Planctomycetaceae bacterium]
AVVLAPDQTWRVIAVTYTLVICTVLLSLWWLLLSGVAITRRLMVAGTVVLLLIGTAVGCVRRVWFDGDMRPRFDFRWEVDPRRVSADWLRQHASTSVDVVDLPEVLVVSPDDWPRYCGWNGNREIAEPAPSNPDWKTQPPRELWRHPVGQGWSSFAVVDHLLFTQEQRGDMECVVCYEAATGQQIWVHQDQARYSTAMGGTGPRATPTVLGEVLYSLGATGLLNCLDSTTGKLVWQTNICSDAESEPLEWGMSGSPLVVGESVIVDAGGSHGRAVIAYDRHSGKHIWASASHKAGYTSVRTEVIDETEQLIVFHGDGVMGLIPETGAVLWEYPWKNIYGVNVAQPLCFGSELFISSGYDSGCVLLDLSDLQSGSPAVPREVWPPNKRMKLKFNEAVARGNHVYGLDDGILCCLDITTGERRWKGGRYRFGQVLLWGDQLLVQAEDGAVALVDATPTEFHEITRFQPLSDRTWNVPVVNRGRLYVRNAFEAACFAIDERH